ncbi:hypothetical protein SAMN05216489_07219 [Streptomyces sp. 3213]|uniref:hypothetical protein n=1 Tax=Streptomyces sp. 3213.3 TaxID=1855348 RepID=UPI00089A7708|nr:hypothetical protein [Streptomyces sp. 3213.3]SEE57722.1 hypothetical protein SAMN05216489_07219 [Streptomyces sp. 3213] [Streptomyces sp. 3213.3]
MTDEHEPDGDLYVLWHARHLAVEQDERVIHLDADGTIHLDEEEWRIIGIYPDQAVAERQREISRKLPGFRDEPDCFEIAPVTVDEDVWNEGFVTVYPEGLGRDS